MKKYAEVFAFGKSEIGDLLKSLKDSGFRILEGMHDRHLYHPSAPAGTAVGNAETFFDGIHLYIFEGVENNPLHGFLERYEASKSSTTSPAASGESRASQVPWPHA